MEFERYWNNKKNVVILFPVLFVPLSGWTFYSGVIFLLPVRICCNRFWLPSSAGAGIFQLLHFWKSLCFTFVLKEFVMSLEFCIDGFFFQSLNVFCLIILSFACFRQETWCSYSSFALFCLNVPFLPGGFELLLFGWFCCRKPRCQFLPVSCV